MFQCLQRKVSEYVLQIYNNSTKKQYKAFVKLEPSWRVTSGVRLPGGIRAIVKQTGGLLHWVVEQIITTVVKNKHRKTEKGYLS